jgi:hypothetical protein
MEWNLYKDEILICVVINIWIGFSVEILYLRGTPRATVVYMFL